MQTNDNQHPNRLLGLDPAGDMFNVKRVEDAANAIAADLRKSLVEDRASEILAGNAESYHCGLTNGETCLATLRALSVIQLEIVAQISTMWDEPEDHDLEIYDPFEAERGTPFDRFAGEGGAA